MPNGYTALQRLSDLRFRDAGELGPVVEKLFNHVGLHLTGADAVNQNSVLRQLGRKALRETDHAELGC